MTPISNIIRVGLLTVIGVFSIGCGGGGPGLAPVEGTIKLDGKPLKNAEVSFEPQLEAGEEGSVSTGTTDENGHYELRYTLHKEGALIGKHLVKIRTAATTYDEEDNEVQSEEKVPAKYNANAKDNPEMTVEVESGGSTIDFDLKGDGEIIQPDSEGEPKRSSDGCQY